jgi:hypothetical protein
VTPASRSRLPVWVPSGVNAREWPVGDDFHLVHVQAAFAESIITRLGARCGPVIHDRTEWRFTWLIKSGSATHWSRGELPGIQVQRSGTVVVPPLSDGHQEGSVRWRVAPAAQGWLTSAELLRAVLTLALRPSGGRR